MKNHTFHFKDFYKAQDIVREMYSIEANLMNLKSLDMQLNAPHPEPANAHDKWMPLERAVGLTSEVLDRIVREGIIKELRKRHNDCKRQLVAMGMRFDPPSRAKKVTRPAIALPAVVEEKPQLGKSLLKLVKPAA